jgi:hypothetical protein
VLSDAVSALWGTVLAGRGFALFAEREISLADVLEPLLTTPDLWADSLMCTWPSWTGSPRPTGRRAAQGRELPGSRLEAERADQGPRVVERGAVRPH